MAKINGEYLNIAGKTIAQYLSDANYDTRRVVVERNELIVAKAKYDEIVIEDDDVIEVVCFVGGG